jgi:hypothetical protein
MSLQSRLGFYMNHFLQLIILSFPRGILHSSSLAYYYYIIAEDLLFEPFDATIRPH